MNLSLGFDTGESDVAGETPSFIRYRSPASRVSSGPTRADVKCKSVGPEGSIK